MAAEPVPLKNASTLRTRVCMISNTAKKMLLKKISCRCTSTITFFVLAKASIKTKGNITSNRCDVWSMPYISYNRLFASFFVSVGDVLL